MTLLEEYYNKFNEEKRFNSRHGQTEFIVSLKYIKECLDNIEKDKCDISILDIGAGTGRYSISLALDGYNVTALELVKHNVARLKQYAGEKGANLEAYQGNALKLKRFKDDSFDLTLLFGPMYHLFSKEDKLTALNEAIRVTKPDGYILVAYCMNDYAFVTYALKEGHFRECIETGRFTDDFKTISKEENLYDYMRISDINELNALCPVERVKIISPDGPANYIRDSLKKLTEEEFEMFIKYQLTVAERPDLIGAGGHVVDILKNRKQVI